MSRATKKTSVLSAMQQSKITKTVIQLIQTCVTIFLKNKLQKEGVMRVLHGLTTLCLTGAVKFIFAEPGLGMLPVLKGIGLFVLGFSLLFAGLFSVKKKTKSPTKHKAKVKTVAKHAK